MPLWPILEQRPSFPNPNKSGRERNPNAGEQKLVVTVWDSTCVSLMKEIAYDQQQRHFSTKTKSNALVKLMGSGLNGTGMYVYCMAASLSPCMWRAVGRVLPGDVVVRSGSADCPLRVPHITIPGSPDARRP